MTQSGIGPGILLLTLVAAPAASQIIDFETIPGQVPAEGLPISDQFLGSHGVTFSLEGGAAPLLAEVGAPMTAFQGPGGGSDNPAPGVEIGSFFLTDDGLLGGAPPPLLITYGDPTAAASGVILDIDGVEAFLIEARDEFDAVLEDVVIIAGDAGTGDGLATPWAFQRAQSEIFSIRIVGNFKGKSGFGLGFDNFNATGICAEAPVDDCLAAAKASVSSQEKKPGGEKLKVKLSGFEMATVREDFGNPAEGTGFDVCLYDDADQLAGGVSVRPGGVCGSKRKPCWKAKGDNGFRYKDPDAATGGVKSLSASSGPAGKGKVKLQAGNKAKKGQTSLPTGISAALAGATGAMVQVLASDAACFEATLGTVNKADPQQFKAKAP